MVRATTLLLFSAFMLCGVGSAQQTETTAAPDTLLVLKNGAEVKGLFIELSEAQYKIRLPDGRIMTYPSGDVEKMERLMPLEGQSSPIPQPPQRLPSVDPSSCAVFVTEKEIDKAFYTAGKDVTVSKKWYGSAAEMYGDLANRAHEVGANAVVAAHTWHSPSAFSWAAPHAGGLAVKLTDAGLQALPKLEGRCY